MHKMLESVSAYNVGGDVNGSLVLVFVKRQGNVITKLG